MTSMTMQDFISLSNQEDLKVLDIREQDVFAQEGHLPNAISMPATSLPNELNRLDKNETYYVISYSGRRSEILANFLENNGFKAVHVIGGMRALKESIAA